ncbi:MAG: peptide chain release factor N(5)-glutamine methyltransferase [Anaerolineaceae bacterium]
MTDVSLASKLHLLSDKLTSRLDHSNETALVLLASVLGQSKTWLLSHPEVILTFDQLEQADTLSERLLAGEPLPYLIGRQEFFGLNFLVDPSVLIPRPETELLVEQALLWLKGHPAAQTALDVGTGSGCIAISLAVHCPRLCITATDNSTQALSVAKRNAQTHRVAENISFVEADLIPPSIASCSLICANLPYIPTGKLAEVNSLPYEPVSALDGGLDGLELIQRCLQQAPQVIQRPGLILLETEATLGRQANYLVQQYFPQGKIALLQDLTGRDRLVRIELES